MDKIQKVQSAINTSSHPLNDKLKSVGFDGLNEGDLLYSRYYGECIITKIDEKGIHCNDENKRNHVISFSDLEYDVNHYDRSYIRMDKNVNYDEELLKYIKNPDDYKKIQKELVSTSKESNTTALILAGGAKDLITAQTLVQRMTDKMAILQSMLEGYKSNFVSLRNEFREKLKKINQVITVLEIYMGIDEQIVQIQQGASASIDEPISFRQQLLYMDEELAIMEQYMDADFRNIEDFENWLLENKNYEVLAPEQKCVVVIKVRRNEKDYGEIHPITKLMLDQKNEWTFVFIRNGENIYKIWTDKFNISPRLFPKIDEFESLKKKVDKRIKEGWSGGSEQEDLERIEMSYKFNILMMQGLIDRTEIFKPLKTEGINLFDPTTYGDSIRLIFDDENTISSGKPSFDEYIKDINSKIERGSRIVLCLEDGWNRKEYSDRFKRYYQSEYSAPNPPSANVYTVEDKLTLNEFKGYEAMYGGKEVGYVILYNPKDEVYNRWDCYDSGHVRKNRLQFFVEQYDRFFNYDLLDLNELEYYMQDRVERQNYLYMFPILRKLKELRLDELKWEKEFVRLVVDRNQVSEEKVWEAVEWWKNKVIWKRPIRKDDAKALRMIEGRIKK